MGLKEVSSYKTLWRGYEYFRDKKVKGLKQVGNGVYEATVFGTKDYKVKIDVNHPRSSICDCPDASGKRKVCKHMIATYFAVFPKEAKEYYEQVIKYEEEYEEEQEKLWGKAQDCISKMSKKELQDELYSILCDAPDWLFEKFVREHDL